MQKRYSEWVKERLEVKGETYRMLLSFLSGDAQATLIVDTPHRQTYPWRSLLFEAGIHFISSSVFIQPERGESKENKIDIASPLPLPSPSFQSQNSSKWWRKEYRSFFIWAPSPRTFFILRVSSSSLVSQVRFSCCYVRMNPLQGERDRARGESYTPGK